MAGDTTTLAIGATPARLPRQQRAVFGQQLYICFVLFCIGTQQTLVSGVTIGDAVLLLTVPIWLTAYRRFHGAAPLLVLGLCTAVSGLVLSSNAVADHIVNAKLQRDMTVTMLGFVASVAAVLYARTVVSNSRIAVTYGLGMLVAAGLHHSQWSTNAWKFAFAIPVTVLVMGLAVRSARRGAGLVSLAALAAISVVLDSRAYAATLALAAVFVLWHLVPRSSERRFGWLWTAGIIVVVAGATYLAATSLLVDGYLGRAVQTRSIEQINTSGSLILGGRPELAASIALLRHYIFGFGVGVVPSSADVTVAKTGLQSINYNPNNGYVDRFLFGGHFELHSVFGDVWAGWGLVGLALIAVIAVLMIRSLANFVTRRGGDALVLYLCAWTLWNIMFSPLDAALAVLVLSCGLSLRSRAAT